VCCVDLQRVAAGWSLLQCVAVHSVLMYGAHDKNKGRVCYGSQSLQCAAVCYSALQCVTVCCSVLQCVVVCCSLLQFIKSCCTVLKIGARTCMLQL